MNDRNAARAFRYATVKTQLVVGSISALEAQDLLNAELTPGDPSTLCDDRGLLSLSDNQIMAILGDDSPADLIQQVLDIIKGMKPKDRSERDRMYAILITDLEKALAYAIVNLGKE